MFERLASETSLRFGSRRGSVLQLSLLISSRLDSILGQRSLGKLLRTEAGKAEVNMTVLNVLRSLTPDDSTAAQAFLNFSVKAETSVSPVAGGVSDIVTAPYWIVVVIEVPLFGNSSSSLTLTAALAPAAAGSDALSFDLLAFSAFTTSFSVAFSTPGFSSISTSVLEAVSDIFDSSN
ncbi:hypothetical protein SAMD00019534_124440, partial [Acytostelium subglobosum LB1]|uniref:hypothetical protein n=1 Tax=Acytostelium subglobosum LB1 TaxID=1410327 RepID=UPI00064506E4